MINLIVIVVIAVKIISEIIELFDLKRHNYLCVMVMAITFF